MIIAQSAVQLSSERTAKEQHVQRESLSIWKDQTARAENGRDRHGEARGWLRKAALADHVHLSERARRVRPQRAYAEAVPEDAKNIADLNIRILAAMVERLTGKVISITLPQDATAETASPVEGQTEGPVEAATDPAAGGVGIAYDSYESHYEYESTSFAAAGSIQTSDGTSIDFSVQLNMTREFMSENRVSIRAGAALKDPLIMNFNGSAAEVTQRDFSFEIDVDGQKDQIAFVGPNSGFLALDRNGDKQINDGSELFGALSGDGFGDLSLYDEDGNNWIDENDSIYQNLRIWMKDSEGQDRLFSLGEKGVGAIYLNHIDTQFALKNSANELLGQVRASGVFLGEDGSVGTVQQIDLSA